MNLEETTKPASASIWEFLERQSRDVAFKASNNSHPNHALKIIGRPLYSADFMNQTHEISDNVRANEPPATANQRVGTNVDGVAV